MLRAYAAVAVLLYVGPMSQVCAAPVVIDGVPRIDYLQKKYSQHIAAVWASLAAQGCPMGYEEVMVASGAAFRTAWWPEYYSYAAPELAPEDLVINAADAAGAFAQRSHHASAEEAWETVCACVDASDPPCVWRSWGSQVIAGYDEAGTQMLVRHYNAATAELAAVPFEAADAPWPLKGTCEVVVVEYDLEGEVPELEWPAILERVVMFADWPPEDKLYGNFVFGLGAYDAWAETLRRGADRNGPKTDAVLCEFMARVMTDARSSAAVVLEQHADVHEAFEEAALYYRDEATLLSGMEKVLSNGTVGTWADVTQAMVANFPGQDTREMAAQLVEQAKEHEIVAVECLREALADLTGAAPAPEPEPVLPVADTEPPPTPDTDAAKAAAADHCEKGKQLKAARRFEDAAGELTEAIKLDPEYVEAHWVLAWVLVELGKRDEAAEMFRKVIELAPDSPEAVKAKAALERIGK